MDSFIKRSFPVPRFLLPPRMSIDVCDGCLRFFRLPRRAGSYLPEAFGTLPFPRVHMGKLDEDDRAQSEVALRAFAKEHDCRRAHVVVHEGEAYVFCVTIKTTNSGQFRSFIESVLEENVPIPPAEAVFEYGILGIDRVRGETLVAVSVIAETTLSHYLDLFRSASIDPVSFETESRALSRALFAPHDATTRVVISIGRNHSTLFIAQGGVVAFSSAIDVGSLDIDASIAKAFGVSEDAARVMKEQRGFAGEGEDPSLFEAMAPVLSIIRDELSKVFVYWKGQGRKEGDLKEISEILLCGKDSALSGLSRYLATSSKLPVRLGSVWTGLSLPPDAVPELSLRDSLDYGSVMGALI